MLIKYSLILKVSYNFKIFARVNYVKDHCVCWIIAFIVLSGREVVLPAVIT